MSSPEFTPDFTRAQAVALDAADPLRGLREQFELPQGLIYLDGNSLGVLPKATAARVQQVVQQEWGQGLIGSWNSAGWISLPQRLGDKIARLVGAAPGELVVADSTSINLFKVLSVALQISQQQPQAAPTPDDPALPRVILSERSNFPTDLYIAQALAAQQGLELRLAEAEALPGLLSGELRGRCAVLMLTHVNYRTGRMHDMAALSAAAHAAGALVLWDLAHSAGAVPVDLHADGADFAVGCGYKYLNGGPGAPAFVWAHPRHTAAALSPTAQPLAGWMGHAAPFEFTPGYTPAPGIQRFLCGTPPLLSMAALECGVDTVLAAEPLGGLLALREKSLALTQLFATLVQAWCPDLQLISPALDRLRGSQVCLAHADWAYPVVQALIERGVIGDFRAPDVLRFGFTPLYLRYVDAWDAADHLRQVLDSGEWREERFNRRQAVT